MWRGVEVSRITARDSSLIMARWRDNTSVPRRLGNTHLVLVLELGPATVRIRSTCSASAAGLRSHSARFVTTHQDTHKMRSGQEAMKLEVQTMSPAPGRGVKKDAESPQTSPIPNKSWRQQAASCMEQHPALRKMWAEPDWASFKIRSKNYLHDKIKINTEEPLFELVWFDLFSGEEKDLLHICQNKKSFAQKAIAKYGSDVPQLFVVTLLVPGSPVVALVQYFALKPEMAKSSCEANQLWKNFLEGDDGFRKSRLKLIPSIPEGPWVIKKSVGNKPVILGHAIQLHFYRTDDYLEVCVDICSERVAKHITSLCRSQSSSFKVDIGFVIEGLTEAELPERLLGCVQYDHLDLPYAIPIRDK